MKELEKTIKLLNDSQVVAIPTETVYGLAARVDKIDGIKKIFSIKERPFFDPLIVHVSSLDMAQRYVTNILPIHTLLAKNFWPGPLTIIFPRNNNIDPLITSGLDKVGIRVPNHPLTLELINKIDCGLAAPSANKFKKTSPTRFSHVEEQFGDEVFILNGDQSEIGIESTVIEVIDNDILIYRPGIINDQDIKEILIKNNLKMNVRYAESPVAPGQLNHHYMPSIPLLLAKNISDLEKFKISYPQFKKIKTWDIQEEPEIVARNLYHQMRLLSSEADLIVFFINDEKRKETKWFGIFNRLDKACSYNLHFKD